jgi:hypothetical protein
MATFVTANTGTINKDVINSAIPRKRTEIQ